MASPTSETSSRGRCSRTSCARSARLTGTHVGCDTSSCGCCVVVMDGDTAVKSCSMFAAQADGHEILTVEGLAQGGTLHALQQGFWDQHGLQCGYCTPGMLLTSYALLKHQPESERGRHPRGAGRKPVPVHRLSEHRQSGAAGGRGARQPAAAQCDDAHEDQSMSIQAKPRHSVGVRHEAQGGSALHSGQRALRRRHLVSRACSTSRSCGARIRTPRSRTSTSARR